jgi:hypothetical protein
MAYLYVGNCTLQKQIVCYRLDFDKHGNLDAEDKFRGHKQEEILPGRQIQLGGDLHKAQIISIIDQLEKNGMKRHDAVSKTTPFTVPYIYREDTPIPADAINRQRLINNGIHEKQGSERRQAAAVGVNKAVLDAASIAQPEFTTVEFEQLNQTDLGESRIEEGVKVTTAVDGRRGPKKR